MDGKAEAQTAITAESEQAIAQKVDRKTASNHQPSPETSTPDDDLPKVHSDADQ